MVQAEPSLHVFASFAAKTQPEFGLQVSSVHGLLSLQTRAGPAVHVLFQQKSTVQALPKLHGYPFGAPIH